MSQTQNQSHIKVFNRWVAAQLAKRQINLESIFEDFSDGTKLINLIEIVSGQTLGRYHKKAFILAQKHDNINIALNFLSKNASITGISSENIIQKNEKLILALINKIIDHYVVDRDEILEWAKSCTEGYSGVDISDYSSSWSSCAAFCALLDRFRPELIQYDQLDTSDHINNYNVAFSACKQLGISIYLDQEDINNAAPYEKSVYLQVWEIYNMFSKAAPIRKIKALFIIPKSHLNVENFSFIHSLNEQNSQYKIVPTITSYSDFHEHKGKFLKNDIIIIGGCDWAMGFFGDQNNETTPLDREGVKGFIQISKKGKPLLLLHDIVYFNNLDIMNEIFGTITHTQPYKCSDKVSFVNEQMKQMFDSPFKLPEVIQIHCSHETFKFDEQQTVIAFDNGEHYYVETGIIGQMEACHSGSMSEDERKLLFNTIVHLHQKAHEG